jgi:hypothetical protein
MERLLRNCTEASFGANGTIDMEENLNMVLTEADICFDRHGSWSEH